MQDLMSISNSLSELIKNYKSFLSRHDSEIEPYVFDYMLFHLGQLDLLKLNIDSEIEEFNINLCTRVMNGRNI